MSHAIRIRFAGQIGQFALNVAFEAPARGVTAVFGPSGCGKTSVLRAVAGLLHLQDGFCAIGDEIWQDAHSFRPVHQRALGYVFQESSLFPHLSVRGNLLYGAPQQKQDHRIRFEDVVDLLGLERFLDRAPAYLSGGERQRVAMGRALLSQPHILLMDEPLSALDRLTKDEIFPFLERLHENLALPVLYVTHDMSEVERLADHLVLMRAGTVVASGPLSTLQSDPALPLAASQEAAVSLDAHVDSYDAADGMATLAVAGGHFLVPSAPLTIGAAQRLRIFAGDVSLARQAPYESTIVNVLRAKVLSVQESGAHQVVAVLGLGEDGQGARLLSRVTARSWRHLGLAPGMSIYAQVKGAALVRKSASASS